MSNNYKASITKRQREMEQKDRVKEREARRDGRKARAAERQALGQVGPQMGAPVPSLGDVDLNSIAPSVIPAADLPPREEAPTRLYVGNLSFDVSTDDLRNLFAELGEVTDVHMVTDRDTGRPRGFAFVSMKASAEARKAIAELDGKEVDGRNIRVNEAEERSSGGGPRRGGGPPRGGRGRY
jgi:cold-inducible RNA-binding protein